MANATETQVLEVEHGSPGKRHTNETFPCWQAWAKPVRGGAVALLVVRICDDAEPSLLSFPLHQLFHTGGVPSTVAVRDVLRHADRGTAHGAIEVALHRIPPRGSHFVVLTPQGGM